MTLGNTIGMYRRKLGLTQEGLAQKLAVTNQAVSKWETDQCCPDTMLLPKLADVLEISLDALFGRETVQKEEPQEQSEPGADLPWEDDDALRIVVFCGRELFGAQPLKKECKVIYEGEIRDVHCAVSLECGDVQGNVTGASYVECGDVGGAVQAGAFVECGDVGGSVECASYVECGDVGGYVRSGSYIECGDVGQDVQGGSYIECGDVGGSVTGGDYVECGDVGGDVHTVGNVECGDVSGSVHASRVDCDDSETGADDGGRNKRWKGFKITFGE